MKFVNTNRKAKISRCLGSSNNKSRARHYEQIIFSTVKILARYDNNRCDSCIGKVGDYRYQLSVPLDKKYVYLTLKISKHAQCEIAKSKWISIEISRICSTGIFIAE